MFLVDLILQIHELEKFMEKLCMYILLNKDAVKWSQEKNISPCSIKTIEFDTSEILLNDKPFSNDQFTYN